MTPLAILKDKVAPLLLQQQQQQSSSSSGSVATTAPPFAVAAAAAAARPGGFSLTREAIGAVSSSFRFLLNIFDSRRQAVAAAATTATATAAAGAGAAADASAACLEEALIKWIQRGLLGAYSCLCAACCSTQTNANVYISLLAAEESGLHALLDKNLLVYVQQMQQQADAALPLWGPKRGPPPHNSLPRDRGSPPHTVSPLGIEWDRMGRQAEAGFVGSLGETGTVSESLVSSLGAAEAFSATRKPAAAGPTGLLLQQLQQLQSLGPAMRQLVHAATQTLHSSSLGATHWLRSLSQAPALSPAFAAAEKGRIDAAAAAAAAAADTSRQQREGSTPQQQVEIILSGRATLAPLEEKTNNVRKQQQQQQQQQVLLLLWLLVASEQFSATLLHQEVLLQLLLLVLLSLLS